MRRTLAILLVAGSVASADDLAPRLRASLVKVRTTSQSYTPTSPWQVTDPRTRTGNGFVVEPGVVLTLASNVRNHRMIQLSAANSATEYEAKLKHVDYGLDLALVEITDPDLRERLKPIELGVPLGVDDEFDVYQLGTDNILERSTGRVVRAAVSGPKLTLRVQTTSSDSGDGQVVIRDGRVVGLLTQTNPSRQRGTVLALETIRRYLHDFEDGDYDGTPEAGFWFQTLLREDLRRYYRVPDDKHGIAVTRVRGGSPADGVLREGDVILAVDGHPIDDEGRFEHPTHGRLDVRWLFQGSKYAGEKLRARVLRDGEVIDVETTLRSWPRKEQVVPPGVVDDRPEFLVVGGLVILELTQQTASGIRRSAGGVILRRYAERHAWDPPEDRKRIVYVDRVLDDIANKGFSDLRHAPILSINGKRIREIADVAAALATPQGRYHVFRFEGLESDFALPADQLEEIDGRVAKTYRIPRLRYLEGDPE